MKKTTDIIKALNQYRPDQAAVIHEMAANRGLDPAGLTPHQYRDLIVEEADFSLEATPPGDEMADAKRYTADLKAIAARI